MTDQRSNEERLLAAGWVPIVDHPTMETIYSLEGPIHITMRRSQALALLDREEAAEARGRAQGQQERREAVRLARVDQQQCAYMRLRKAEAEYCDKGTEARLNGEDETHFKDIASALLLAAHIVRSGPPLGETENT